MGSSTTSSGSPYLKFAASSPESITKVTLLKMSGGGQFTPIKTYSPNTLAADGVFQDTAFTADSAYAVQVDLANTDMAHSSPVWVTKTA
jgi:hypothetical protein